MSDKTKVTLIHNPTAGDERHSADDLVAIVEDAGFQVRYQSSKKGWKKALREPADLIVAAGGDGTLAKVLKEAAGGTAPVALLALGTANNIGRTFRVLAEVEEVVRGWRDARPQPLDFGRITWGSRRAVFVEGCGGGVFARAIEEGDKIETSAEFAGHELDRALAFIAQQLERSPGVAWRVTADGEDLSGEYIGVEVLNVPFAGPSVPLAPAADPADGRLDVVLIGRREREDLLKYLDRRLHDAAAEAPRLTVRRASEVVLEAAEGPFRVDDKIVAGGAATGSQAPCYKISVEAGAVQVIAPARASG